MEIDDGGPAFPQPPIPYRSDNPPGMSLRDWYAGQAMNAILGNASDFFDSGEIVKKEAVVESAFLYADAMIAAGKQEPVTEAGAVTALAL